MLPESGAHEVSDGQVRSEVEQTAGETPQGTAEQAVVAADAARMAAEQLVGQAQQAQTKAETERAEAERRADDAVKAREKTERRVRKTEQKTSQTERDAIQLSASYAQDATLAGVPRQVAVYAQWEGSSARAAARARLLLFGVFATACLLAAALLGTFTATGDLGVEEGVIAGGTVLLYGIGAMTVGGFMYGRTLASFLSKREQATAEADKSNDDGTRDKDLDELLRLNRTQMQAYQSVSRAQQRGAFRSSLIALFVGLGVLVGGIVVVVVINGDTSKVAVAGVAALGSALSSYIASTYLKLHREAAQQLRFFSDQPIVTSYIYEAERLVTKLPKGNSQAATYKDVIKDVLGIANRDAVALYKANESEPASGRATRGKAKARSRQTQNKGGSTSGNDG